MIKRLYLFGLLLMATFCAAAGDSISYIPEFHGVLRGRWELDTKDGYSHFQVRNARVSLEGNAAPIIKYKFNVDLCDRGKIMLLDAFATISPLKKFDILVGQYRMPFGIESFRGPGGYYFNNRSYIGKHINNYRAVGLSAAYTLEKVPLTFEGGVFNPTQMDDHTTWVKKYAYAGRAIYRPSSWTIAGGFESIIPGDVRINLASATLGWQMERFYIEGEYIARWYTHNSHKTTHGYNIFANYGLPLKKGLFDTWSFQARFDGTTALASGFADTETPEGKLKTTFDGRKRLTVGSTLDYKFKFIRAAVRLNYEKCWFDHKAPGNSKEDVLSAELIVKF